LLAAWNIKRIYEHSLIIIAHACTVIKINYIITIYIVDNNENNLKKLWLFFIL